MSDGTTKFDRRITNIGKSGGAPHRLVDAAVYVHDTLEVAWISACEIAGQKSAPDLVLGIYDRINAERLRRVAEDNSRTEDE